MSELDNDFSKVDPDQFPTAPAYHAFVARQCGKVLRRYFPDYIDDAVQETMVRVHKHFRKHAPSTVKSRWGLLKDFARKSALNIFQKEARHLRTHIPLDDEESIKPFLKYVHTHSPLDPIILSHEWQSLISAHLTPQQFEIWFLVQIQGLKKKEISKMLGIPPSTLHGKIEAIANIISRLVQSIEAEDRQGGTGDIQESERTP